MANKLLGKMEIIRLLTELGAYLNAQEKSGAIFLVGGAAIALAYDGRRITRDLDGVFEPKLVIYQAAEKVAAANGLEPDWLNDAVKGLLPGKDVSAETILALPGITVSVASPEYLLAMKVAAARVERDHEDIILLAQICGLNNAQEVLDTVTKVWGSPNRLLPKSKFLVEEIFSALPD